MISSHPRKLILLFGILLLGSALIASSAVLARPGDAVTPRVRLAAPLNLPVSTYLVYAETSPSSTESSIWAAPAGDLTAARLLASVSHRVGYPPMGSVSPDGQWVAIFVIPPGVDERAARIDGGELWLAASDGSRLDRLASGVARLAHWAPDSSAVAWSRLVELENPREEQIPFRTEVYRSALDGSAPSLLLADETAYGVVPLGWSTGGERYLAAMVGMDSAWSVQAYDVSTAEPVEAWPLPALEQMRSMTLSPNADRVLIENVAGGEDQLLIVPLDADAGLQAQSTLASAPFSETSIASPVAAVWSADGSRLWLYRAPQGGDTASAQVLAVQPDGVEVTQQAALAVSGTESLLPASWSPDTQWFAWLGFPRLHSDVYLQNGPEGGLTKVPMASPDNWISLFGWMQGSVP